MFWIKIKGYYGKTSLVTGDALGITVNKRGDFELKFFQQPSENSNRLMPTEKTKFVKIYMDSVGGGKIDRLVFQTEEELNKYLVNISLAPGLALHKQEDGGLITRSGVITYIIQRL